MRIFFKTISIILVVLFVIMIPVNVVIRMFDNTISLMIPGNKFWELEGEDPDAQYFKGDYASEIERLQAGRALCYQLEADGAALLLNNGALSLAEGAKVSTLSSNAVNLVYGGTGSGKTECYLYPILNSLMREKENGTLDSGVRALLIFPMNALATERICSVSFGKVVFLPSNDSAFSFGHLAAASTKYRYIEYSG